MHVKCIGLLLWSCKLWNFVQSLRDLDLELLDTIWGSINVLDTSRMCCFMQHYVPK